MEEKPQPNFKINQGRRKIGASGNVIEEEWISIEGANKKEVVEEVDKRWKSK